MPAGRPPDPSAVKILKGETRPHRHSKSEPKPKVYLPPVPESLDPIAADEWKRIAQILYDVRVLTRADLAILRGYCVNFSVAYRAEQTVDREGITVTEQRPTGMIEKEHPANVARNKAHRQMLDFARELGLTPSARTKISAQDVDRPAEVLDFVGGKKRRPSATAAVASVKGKGRK